MKNKRIIDSWDKIEPDSAADERMLAAILARNKSGKSEKGKEFTMKRIFNLKRLAPVAVCLVLVIALTVVIGNNANWFNPATYTADLGNGELLTFYKADVPTAASLDFGVNMTSRNLTPDEKEILFGDLTDVTAYGHFRTSDKSLIHVEGKTGETKVIFAASGIPVTDAIIEADTKESSINGVSVFAGYFITKANSHGVKNIIYFASFNLDDVSVYVELGGGESESENLRNEIANVVDKITQNSTFDLSKITG